MTQTKTKLTGRSLVPGLTLQHKGNSFQAINPANDQPLDPIYTGIEPGEVDAIASQAHSAFPEYRSKSGKKRAAFLRAMADEIETVVEDLVQRTCAETALPEARVRGETARTTGQLRLFAAMVEDGSWVDARIEHAQPDRKPLPKPDVRSMMQPLGPVAVFCASNFPLAFSVAGGDTASALAAGCPVVVKAHHSHPGTAEIVGHAVMAAARKSGMPAGTFSLVYGGGRDVGVALVKHPSIKAVGFTGSRSGGTALMKAAAARPEPIPVYAEMSSVNPVIILPDALSTRANAIVKGLHASVTLGMGQFCTNPGLVFLPAGKAATQFASALKKVLQATPDGHLLNTGIAAAYRDGLDKRDALKGKGVEVLRSVSGGAAGGQCSVGTALFKTRVADFLAHPSLAEEAFGPATTLVTYADEDELLQAIHSLEGQLTGTIHGTRKDLADAGTLIQALEAKVGRLIYGGFPTGVEVCHSMVHGGPFPATSDGRSTSVGTLAIYRFTRPICYQDAPPAVLPEPLKDANPLGLARLVDGKRV